MRWQLPRKGRAGEGENVMSVRSFAIGPPSLALFLAAAGTEAATEEAEERSVQ